MPKNLEFLEKKVKTASVRVMRSYDYCHFEVTLGVNSEEYHSIDLADVNELRKDAQRLVDEAVSQFAKARKYDYAFMDKSAINAMMKANEEAEKVPESERTPQQKAHIKNWADYIRWKNYDYDDDFNDQEIFDEEFDPGDEDEEEF